MEHKDQFTVHCGVWDENLNNPKPLERYILTFCSKCGTCLTQHTKDSPCPPWSSKDEGIYKAKRISEADLHELESIRNMFEAVKAVSGPKCNLCYARFDNVLNLLSQFIQKHEISE